MRIRILKLYSSTQEATVPCGSTQGEAIEAAGTSREGYCFTVRGSPEEVAATPPRPQHGYEPLPCQLV